MEAIKQYFVEFFPRMFTDFSNPLLSAVRLFNFCAIILFFIMISHQFLYSWVGRFKKARFVPKKGEKIKNHNYAIMLPARNEEQVIGNLIDSIRATKYPQENLTIVLIADNCTDNTAQVGRDKNCIVFERNNKEQIGKGYALHFAFEKLHTEDAYKDMNFDGYFIFDSDNLVHEDFFYQMNGVFGRGYDVVSSYRQSKNFGQNYITSTYALWYLHDSRYLANPKMTLGINNGAITGTGILIRKQVIVDHDNWNSFCLTEDVEFAAKCVAEKRKIGFTYDAIHYDEQAADYKTTVRQRERYVKGFIQVVKKDFKPLFKNMFKDFSCYDTVTSILPILIFLPLLLTVNPIIAIVGACMHNTMAWVAPLLALGYAGIALIATLYSFALMPIISEKDRIDATFWQKAKAVLFFPFFMLDFFFVAVESVLRYKKIGWVAIKHKTDNNILKKDKKQKTATLKNLETLPVNALQNEQDEETEKNADIA